MSDNVSAPLRIVSWTLAKPAKQRAGLIAYVRLLVHVEWRIDVTVRRCLAGRYVVSFPTKRTENGRQHMIAGPSSRSARSRIERTILRELGLDVGGPSKDEPPSGGSRE